MAEQDGVFPGTPLQSVSADMSDFLTGRVLIEHDAEGAERWGAFEETALSADEAWEANGDLSVPEA